MKVVTLLAVLLVPAIGFARPPAAEPAVPMASFEVFRLVPGRQEAFIRKLAQWDEVSAAGGQPRTQMFLHQEGEGWDVLLFKPHPTAPVTPAQQAAMDAKAKALGLATGPAFWLEIRRNVASHSETTAQGPMFAADWLARLDAWRAANPGSGQGQ
ncbi:hypothetical protein P6144_10980 [Sphingomonas sp. HITSZ_GF]|uniref:hypothetical protein n=1 Tax=Sphingomonas sp. HITSZ_GF TaxID=3037247 RepID=UPI00240E59BD|nr:hypothetical protein [Sphingomonas sp. HITSZ_GF]MDG2534174.1 hypothetical protein [Sphingomonas sp. HITSZ_GF]